MQNVANACQWMQLENTLICTMVAKNNLKKKIPPSG